MRIDISTAAELMSRAGQSHSAAWTAQHLLTEEHRRREVSVEDFAEAVEHHQHALRRLLDRQGFGVSWRPGDFATTVTTGDPCDACGKPTTQRRRAPHHALSCSEACDAALAQDAADVEAEYARRKLCHDSEYACDHA